MDNRATIPVLAAIGLSFTDCVDKPEPVNPIVGEWIAIQIDGEKFPMTYSEGPYSVAYGVDMEIDDDLSGDIAFYQDADYGGLHYHQETSSDLTVDESGAPKYRIEIAKEFFGGGYSEPPGYTSIGYSDSGYNPTTGYADTGYAPTTGPIDDAMPRPIVMPRAPNAASPELVLNCTLDGDALACEREGTDEPSTIIFKRKPPEDPAGG